jgi:hypothetical protein
MNFSSTSSVDRTDMTKLTVIAWDHKEVRGYRQDNHSLSSLAEKALGTFTAGIGRKKMWCDRGRNTCGSPNFKTCGADLGFAANLWFVIFTNFIGLHPHGNTVSCCACCALGSKATSNFGANPILSEQ